MYKVCYMYNTKNELVSFFSVQNVAILAQQLSHRILIFQQMQTPIIFLSCRFFNNPIP